MYNNILVKRIEAFIALNPEVVDSVLTKWGIRKDIPLNIETLVNAFRLYGEPFAHDVYLALIDDIEKIENRQLSNLVADTTSVSGTATKERFDWDSFLGGLTGLAGTAPGIIDSAKGNVYPSPTAPNPNVPGYYPGPTTSSMSILMYVGIGVFILVILLIVFKGTNAKK